MTRNNYHLYLFLFLIRTPQTIFINPIIILFIGMWDAQAARFLDREITENCNRIKSLLPPLAETGRAA